MLSNLLAESCTRNLYKYVVSKIWCKFRQVSYTGNHGNCSWPVKPHSNLFCVVLCFRLRCKADDVFMM